MNLAAGDILISTEYLNIAEKYILEKTENRVAPDDFDTVEAT